MKDYYKIGEILTYFLRNDIIIVQKNTYEK